MLYSEIIAVCPQIHTKHINTLCGQNVECIRRTPCRLVKLGGDVSSVRSRRFERTQCFRFRGLRRPISPRNSESFHMKAIRSAETSWSVDAATQHRIPEHQNAFRPYCGSLMSQHETSVTTDPSFETSEPLSHRHKVLSSGPPLR